MMMLAMVITALVVSVVLFDNNTTSLSHNEKVELKTIATVYNQTESVTNFELRLLRRLHRRLRIRLGAVF